METKTAIVFGATGLVGKALIDELCRSDRYETIKIFVRRDSGFSCREKVREFMIDFERIKDYSGIITGNDLFICLGTTIKKAGSVKKMEEIDRDLPLEIASSALRNEVERVAVISSLGANPRSSNYYLRIKGEMEAGMMKLNFGTLVILRPSILMGEREERRPGEEIGKVFMKISDFFLIGKLAKYKGIEGTKVARAMVKAVNDRTGTVILESDALQKIAAE